MTDVPLVRLEGVYKHYKNKQALQALDLALYPGKILALLGHNGAGKSTLIKLICGLIQPSGGEIQRWQDKEDSWRERLGYLPESINFNSRLSGLDTLRFYARLKKADDKQCQLLLDQVGLSGKDRQRPVGEYSKGMRQRLGLAQALLGQPRLLLLDEPTSGLDPSVRRDVYQLLNEQAASGCSILISSHALDEIEYRCSDFAILRQGRLIAHNNRDELLKQARLPIEIKVWSQDLRQLHSAVNGYPFHEVDENSWLIECPAERKLAMLQQLSQHPAVDNLAIHEPRLSELYSRLNDRPGDRLNQQQEQP